MNGRSSTSSQRSNARARTAWIVALALLGASLVVLGSPGTSVGGTPATTIAFLNPSSFADAGERGIIVSNMKPDSGPGCCDAADDTYRLAAWVANPPPTYSVFFSVTQGALEFEITNTHEVVNGTWQAQWSMPSSLLDAPAVIHAFVVVGDQAVASVDQPVTIQRVQENIDLGYPLADGAFGTYAALATALPANGPAQRKKPAGVVDALYTATPDMDYIRTFYTTSTPGTAPKWTTCGTETNNGSIDNGVRCTLKSATDQAAITAVAAVANDSPNDYDDRFNESGDAVRILDSYAQVPTALSADGAQQKVADEPRSGIFYCSGNIVTTLTDQVGRQIAGANEDVHAEGPSDGLKFHTFSILTTSQPPDRQNHHEEAGFDCTGQNPSAGTPPGNANPDVQGEHQRFGQPDRKHIESLGSGTTDAGTWTFRLHSEEAGQTFWTAWIDERDDGCAANDDLFTDGEPNVSGSLGWNAEAPDPVTEPLEPFVPCDAGASPSPSPSPTGNPAQHKTARRISLFAARGTTGSSLRLYGKLTSRASQCRSSQQVRIEMKAHRRYRLAGHATTDARGKYTFEKPSQGVRTYRAAVPQSRACKGARSNTVRAG